MKIEDIRMHVLKHERPALVKSFAGLIDDSGPAGEIQHTLVRIITNTGIEGHYVLWSEIPTARPNALAEVLRLFKPQLIGEDPLDRERIWQKFGALWFGQKGPAFAAVDIALWDIAGKFTNLPIYKLLGAYRDKVRAYASGNVPQNEDDIVRIAKELKKMGYTAMKLHPIPFEICKALREAVGDELDLMYDAVFSHTRQEALKVGRELERLNFFWYEAPLPAYDIEGYIRLSNRLDIPITVELPLSAQYTAYIRRGAVDFVRTLSAVTGGITEMRKVASLCESFCLNWEPHGYGGSHYQAATLHAILATGNTAFFELPIENGEEGCFDFGTKDVIRIDSDGYVHGPQKPGLGLEVDWELVEKGAEVEI